MKAYRKFHEISVLGEEVLLSDGTFAEWRSSCLDPCRHDPRRHDPSRNDPSRNHPSSKDTSR